MLLFLQRNEHRCKMNIVDLLLNPILYMCESDGTDGRGSWGIAEDGGKAENRDYAEMIRHGSHLSVML